MFLQDKVIFQVEGSIRETAMDCNAQALALEEERLAIEALLENESCQDETVNDQGLINLLNGTSGVVNELACPGINNAADCSKGLACNLLTSIIPGGAQGARFAFKDHPTLSSCGQGGNCFTNIGKAIWDNLWDTVTGIYDLGKMGLSWMGDQLGSLWNAEDQTSQRGIAATEISDSELSQFLADPVNYVYNFGSKVIDMITQGISSRYGCAEWTGVPHLSECIKPMSWECANCNEKLNMVCGVTGYVGANLVTAFFTGGATAAVQLTSKVASASVISIAKAIPGAARIGEVMAQAGKLSRVGSLVSGTIKNVWNAVKASRTVQGVASVASQLKAAGIVANNFARKNVVLFAAGQDSVIDAVKAYNRLSISAFRLGYQSTGKAAADSRNFLYSQYPKLSEITTGRFANVNNTQDYFREATKAMSPADRARMRVTVTTDAAGDRRVVLHDLRQGKIESDVTYNFSEIPPPAPVVRPPALADRRNQHFSPEAAERIAQNPNEHLEIISDIVEKKVDGYSGSIILQAFEKRAETGADLGHFRERQLRVRSSLESIGLSSDEALEAAEKLFKSGALGRTPPPDEIGRILKASPTRLLAYSPVTEKAVSEVAATERVASAAAKEEFINRWATRNATTPKDNSDYIELAVKGNEPGLMFLDTQNTALKRLNDTLRDKSLVDAFGNRYNALIQDALAEFKRKYPNVTINTYSDYKSMRAAIRGPPGSEETIMNELAQLVDRANTTFKNEVTASGLIDDKYISEHWFRGGVGRSADEANLVTRFSRRDSDTTTLTFSSGTSQERIKNAWELANLNRTQIVTRFDNTPLVRTIEGTDIKIPTAEVLEVVRKNNDPNVIAQILSGRYKTAVSERDAKMLKKYFDQVDQFSPGLMIASRVEHRFDDAVHGGFSIDFAGVGSVNAEATAMGLAQGRNVNESIRSIRTREIKVTEDLDALKLRTENAMKAVLDRHGITSQITVSGDDMLVVPSKPLTPEIRREIAEAQVRAQVGTSTLPSGMRTSFFNSGIPDQTSRSIQATIGETIEKKLRKRLEGVLTPEELRQSLIAIEMRGTSPGTGSVGYEVVNPNLSPRSKQIIEREFNQAVQDINADLIKEGQIGTLNQLNSWFTPRLDGHLNHAYI